MVKMVLKVIKENCLKSDLSTHDPYDIWKTDFGIMTKTLFYKNRFLGFIPSALLSIIDHFFNPVLRGIYRSQEYPIVRALAGMTLMNMYQETGKATYLYHTVEHLRWLTSNSCRGYSGYCWGLNFEWASKNGLYSSNTPFNTITPYVLEALVTYRHITGSLEFDSVIKSIFWFLEKDTVILHEDHESLALSYGPGRELRIVLNANSYILYSYLLLLDFFPEKKDWILDKIVKIYQFIKMNQNASGSWFYFADTLPGNFIDCFHTCFILQNLIKSCKLTPTPLIEGAVIRKGVQYLKDNFFDKNTGLYKRFTLSDTFSLVKFDLYDNAEMLNLLFLLDEKEAYHRLRQVILEHFKANDQFFSKVDIMGRKLYKNNLRWALMPYLYASSLEK